jgi:hypothetical protein
LEKDVAATVNGHDYTNVIKVELIQVTQGITNTNYYWFAKDIGLIRYENIYQELDDIHELDSYIVN